MRPPRDGGGDGHAMLQQSTQHDRFNEAPPRWRGRFACAGLIFRVGVVASMRPPRDGGGDPLANRGLGMPHAASMRPPRDGGGDE